MSHGRRARRSTSEAASASHERRDSPSRPPKQQRGLHVGRIERRAGSDSCQSDRSNRQSVEVRPDPCEPGEDPGQTRLGELSGTNRGYWGASSLPGVLHSEMPAASLPSPPTPRRYGCVQRSFPTVSAGRASLYTAMTIPRGAPFLGLVVGVWRPSRPTSARCCSSSDCATAHSSSSLPTNPASSRPRKRASRASPCCALLGGRLEPTSRSRSRFSDGGRVGRRR
jgi:hypothetical protein